MRLRRIFRPAGNPQRVWHNADLERMADIARDLGARMGTGEVVQALLGANTALNLGALTNLVAPIVPYGGTWAAYAWGTFDGSTVAGSCDLAILAGTAVTVAPFAGPYSSSGRLVGTAAIPTEVTVGPGVFQVNPGAPAPAIGGGPPVNAGTLQLQAFCAAGTTGAQARATSEVNAYAGATGILLLSLS